MAPLKTRTWAPTEGDVVTFTHSGFLWATKKPKLPSLQRRADIEWNDVLLNWKEPIPSSRRNHPPHPQASQQQGDSHFLFRVPGGTPKGISSEGLLAKHK